MDDDWLRLFRVSLRAVALSVPGKSDLQRRDIVLAQDPAPLVVCGNNRRQRRLHEPRGHAFADGHPDASFNAALALAGLVAAAEAAGLGRRPVGAIRDEAEAVSRLLHPPAPVFSYAGLTLGWPAAEGVFNPRLPLAATVHMDRFDDAALPAHVADADRRRIA